MLNTKRPATFTSKEHVSKKNRFYEGTKVVFVKDGYKIIFFKPTIKKKTATSDDVEKLILHVLTLVVGYSVPSTTVTYKQFLKAFLLNEDVRNAWRDIPCSLSMTPKLIHTLAQYQNINCQRLQSQCCVLLESEHPNELNDFELLLENCEWYWDLCTQPEHLLALIRIQRDATLSNASTLTPFHTAVLAQLEESSNELKNCPDSIMLLNFPNLANTIGSKNDPSNHKAIKMRKRMHTLNEMLRPFIKQQNTANNWEIQIEKKTSEAKIEEISDVLLISSPGYQKQKQKQQLQQPPLEITSDLRAMIKEGSLTEPQALSMLGWAPPSPTPARTLTKINSKVGHDDEGDQSNKADKDKDLKKSKEKEEEVVVVDARPKKRREGDKVRAKCSDYPNFCSGTIARVNSDGTYDILFDDGFRKLGIVEEKIKGGGEERKRGEQFRDVTTKEIVPLKEYMRRYYDVYLQSQKDHTITSSTLCYASLVGSRVEVKWGKKGKKWYWGTFTHIDVENDGKIVVLYDDGDKRSYHLRTSSDGVITGLNKTSKTDVHTFAFAKGLSSLLAAGEKSVRNRFCDTFNRPCVSSFVKRFLAPEDYLSFLKKKVRREKMDKEAKKLNVFLPSLKCMNSQQGWNQNVFQKKAFTFHF